MEPQAKLYSNLYVFRQQATKVAEWQQAFSELIPF
jgi:hypothetical protein